MHGHTYPTYGNNNRDAANNGNNNTANTSLPIRKPILAWGPFTGTRKNPGLLTDPSQRAGS